jgi:ferredoxin--NADP+ reductase
MIRIAVVGAGPAGFFAAADLLRRLPEARVDLYERLFAPFGLVRYGVAPDHPKTKSVEKVFALTAADPRLTFHGNLEVGRDVPVDELRAAYTAVIFTCGARRSRPAGVPGESLPGVRGAADFVAWYNGHPDLRDATFDLSHPTAVVIGNGNVALDCARLLTQDPEHLAGTDIADHALTALRASRVREVWVIGRRGPAQAACTPVELSELRDFPGLRVRVEAEELRLDPASAAELESPRDRTRPRLLELLRGYAADPPPPASVGRTLRFAFLRQPEAFLGDDRLAAVRLARTRLEGEPHALRAVPTGEREEIPCGLALVSTGYTGDPLPGLPFDAARGVLPHTGGRVHGHPGLYVAGWLKRGPQGVIGTNKKDAAETVDALLADLPGLPAPAPGPTPAERRREAGHRVLAWADWLALDARERAAGAAAGRPRVKALAGPD